MRRHSDELRAHTGLTDVERIEEALRSAQESLVFIKNWMRTECLSVTDFQLVLFDAENALTKITSAIAAMQPQQPAHADEDELGDGSDFGVTGEQLR